ARYYRSRSLALEAVKGGHVHINGERGRPSHPIKPGDVLKITKAGATYEIEVQILSERRGNAAAAQALYRELPESLARREQQRELYRLNALCSPRPAKRPDKRERRALQAWRHGHD
ncbi:MAG: S4 domain-containing protein, partial [Gammaproteobacteria bacterium]